MGKGIEFQFVESWDAWDEVETFCLQFYKCALKQSLANIVGFPMADIVIVDCEHCVIQVFETNESEPIEFKFSAQVVL